MGLNPKVLAGIEKLGYESPTRIQEEVIRDAALGKNIIGQSQTGTGKTAAFIISLLEKIDPAKKGVQAIILAPTRELVMQIRDEIVALSTAMGNVHSLPVYGGSPIGRQIEMLRRGQTIVVGTPGRVIDLIERRALRLADVQYFVLDEVDRMLDMGFIEDIDFIWSQVTNVQQAFAFSATITPEMKNIVEKYLGVDYTFIKATDGITVDKIDHSFVDVPHIAKYDALKKFIITHEAKKTIVFVQMKRDTEDLTDRLVRDGLRAACLNGDMRQRERFKALKDFQDGHVHIFVVTDVAARGINVKNIDLVVNYDVPNDPESYIHRIGRTGRAGADGRAIMLVARDEQPLFRNIERRNKITIRQIDLESNHVERAADERRGGGEGRGGYSGGGGYRGRGGRGGSAGPRGGFGGHRSGFDRPSGGGGYARRGRDDDRRSAPAGDAPAAPRERWDRRDFSIGESEGVFNEGGSHSSAPRERRVWKEETNEGGDRGGSSRPPRRGGSSGGRPFHGGGGARREGGRREWK